MEVVASLSQGRTAAAHCSLFTHKSVPVIFEPPACLVSKSISSLLLILRILSSLLLGLTSSLLLSFQTLSIAAHALIFHILLKTPTLTVASQKLIYVLFNFNYF